MVRSMKCLVCESEEIRTFYPPEQGYAVVRCKTCGLVFHPPQEAVKRIEEVYKREYYFSDDAAFGYENYIAEKDNIQKTFSKRVEVIKRFAPAGHLLDVGCALGYFLEMAHRAGYAVKGIDVSPWASQYAKEHYRFEVIAGTLEECTAFPEGFFDIITLWDVMEQLPHPKLFIHKVSSLLKKGGYVFLTMRDIDSIVSRVLKRKWIHFRPREKFVYFNGRSIRRLLEDENLAVEFTTYHGMGKDCTLRTLIHKLSHYGRWLAAPLDRVCSLLRLQEASVYLNFYDSQLIAARKMS